MINQITFKSDGISLGLPCPRTPPVVIVCNVAASSGAWLIQYNTHTAPPRSGKRPDFDNGYSFFRTDKGSYGKSAWALGVDVNRGLRFCSQPRPAPTFISRFGHDPTLILGPAPIPVSLSCYDPFKNRCVRNRRRLSINSGISRAEGNQSTMARSRANA
jgi:hypothetical protein